MKFISVAERAETYKAAAEWTKQSFLLFENEKKEIGLFHFSFAAPSGL